VIFPYPAFSVYSCWDSARRLPPPRPTLGALSSWSLYGLPYLGNPHPGGSCPFFTTKTATKGLSSGHSLEWQKNCRPSFFFRSTASHPRMYFGFFFPRIGHGFEIADAGDPAQTFIRPSSIPSRRRELCYAGIECSSRFLRRVLGRPLFSVPSRGACRPYRIQSSKRMRFPYGKSPPGRPPRPI